ncbi:MAG: hypothetical protein ACTSUE_16795 [Promethearchaeota archaeon]
METIPVFVMTNGPERSATNQMIANSSVMENAPTITILAVEMESVPERTSVFAKNTGPERTVAFITSHLNVVENGLEILTSAMETAIANRMKTVSAMKGLLENAVKHQIDIRAHTNVTANVQITEECVLVMEHALDIMIVNVKRDGAITQVEDTGDIVVSDALLLLLHVVEARFLLASLVMTTVCAESKAVPAILIGADFVAKPTTNHCLHAVEEQYYPENRVMIMVCVENKAVPAIPNGEVSVAILQTNLHAHSNVMGNVLIKPVFVHIMERVSMMIPVDAILDGVIQKNRSERTDTEVVEAVEIMVVVTGNQEDHAAFHVMKNHHVIMNHVIIITLIPQESLILAAERLHGRAERVMETENVVVKTIVIVIMNIGVHVASIPEGSLCALINTHGMEKRVVGTVFVNHQKRKKNLLAMVMVIVMDTVIATVMVIVMEEEEDTEAVVTVVEEEEEAEEIMVAVTEEEEEEEEAVVVTVVDTTKNLMKVIANVIMDGMEPDVVMNDIRLVAMDFQRIILMCVMVMENAKRTTCVNVKMIGTARGVRMKALLIIVVTSRGIIMECAVDLEHAK